MEMTDESGLPGGREEMLAIIAQFRLIDDTFMTKVFEDKECAELLLRVILNRDDLTVVKTATQFEIKNLQGRSILLDIYATDTEGKQYDIEVQRDNGGAEPRRARYNSSLMDANSLISSHDVSELPETYVVFITEYDFFEAGKPIYTIQRKVDELDNKIFGDGSRIIYVNAEIRDETKLGRLMQDFFCTDPRKMHNEVLSNRARYFKESDEGVDTMCKLMEDYAEKNRKRGEEIGRKKSAAEFALRLREKGCFGLEEIAELSKLPLDEVKKLLEESNA